MATSAQTQCRLFAIPAELRNRIYCLAIEHDDPITVTSDGFDVPPLLRTCRRVRQEARAIFYANHFIIESTGFDPKTPRRFADLLKDLIQQKQLAKSHIDISILPTPHWRNLVAWLKLYHENKLPSIRYGRETEEDGPHTSIRLDYLARDIIASMFNVVEGLKDLPWMRVGKLIEGQRCALARLDPAWDQPE